MIDHKKPRPKASAFLYSTVNLSGGIGSAITSSGVSPGSSGFGGGGFPGGGGRGGW
ncbi:MAG: hypothetical protein J7K01_00215 [Thermovirga sp.]|nr:hypothetical protein [Thermovirga sp.]